MGDVGSQFCGFVLAMLGVVASRFDGVELSLLLMPMLLSGVLFDVAFTLARRALARERLTQAHRGHLYQVAQRTGVPASVVALIHWGFAICGGGCCLLFIAAPPPFKPFIPALTLLPQAAWVAVVHTRSRISGLTRLVTASRVRASRRPPAASKSRIVAMPARWLPAKAVATPSASGPIKPVTRPDRA